MNSLLEENSNSHTKQFWDDDDVPPNLNTWVKSMLRPISFTTETYFGRPIQFPLESQPQMNIQTSFSEVITPTSTNSSFDIWPNYNISPT